MLARVGLGFRVHSGWAAMVALGGKVEFPEMIERTRVALIDPETGGVAQPYHAAEEMDPTAAETYIASSADSSSAIAREQLEALLVTLRAKNLGPAGCAILYASGHEPGVLTKILASHAMIHTAEGVFFRNALALACEQLALHVLRLKEREVWTIAEEKLGLPAERLQGHLAVIGKRAGPPWTQDQKFAALAAWIAL